MGWVVGEIDELGGVFAEIVEFFGGAFGEGEIVEFLPLGLTAVEDEPCFGGAGVHVCEGDVGVRGEAGTIQVPS